MGCGAVNSSRGSRRVMPAGTHGLWPQAQRSMGWALHMCTWATASVRGGGEGSPNNGEETAVNASHSVVVTHSDAGATKSASRTAELARIHPWRGGRGMQGMAAALCS